MIKIKKIMCLTAVVGILLSLCSCGSYQVFEDKEWDLKVSFPKDMHVFTVAETTEDDPALAEYNVKFSDIQTFADVKNGGKFYGKSKTGGREYSVSVLGSQNTIDIWEISQNNKEELTDVVNSASESLNVDGYAVVSEKEYPQDGCCFVEYELQSNKADSPDAMMIFTVKNGLQYSAIYKCDVLTPEYREEASDLFYNFFVTKNLPKNETDEVNQTGLIMIIVIVALIIVFIIVIIVNYSKAKSKENNQQKYKKQFDFELNDTDGKKPNGKKRG